MTSQTVEDRLIAGTWFTTTQHTLSPGQFRTTYKVNGQRVSRRLYISYRLSAEQRDRDLSTIHLTPPDSLNVGTCGAMGRDLKFTCDITEVTCADCLTVHDEICEKYKWSP